MTRRFQLNLLKGVLSFFVGSVLHTWLITFYAFWQCSNCRTVAIRSRGSICGSAHAPVSRRRLQKSSQHIVSSVLVQQAMLSAVNPPAHLRFRQLLRTWVKQKRCFFFSLLGNSSEVGTKCRWTSKTSVSRHQLFIAVRCLRC